MNRPTRRSFLGQSAAIAGTLLLPPATDWANAFAQSSPMPDKNAAPATLFLFVDWLHVKKGELEVTLDASRLSEPGKKLVAELARDFNKTFAQGGDGRKRVDIPFGVRITQEVATKSKPWLVADKPWESSVSGVNVIREDGRYRCWYIADLNETRKEMTIADGRGMELAGSILAYAESQDGMNWTKPSLKVQSYGGSMENNLVTPYCNGGAVFRDDHGLPEERYKIFHFEKLPDQEITKDTPTHNRYGLYGATSPDGYRWKLNSKLPLVRHFSDTVNIAAWDAGLGSYVGYFRCEANGGRAISRSETKDFWNWPHPEMILASSPTEAPADDLYNNGYTVYPDDPSLRILFVAVYHRNTDGVDVRAMISRDGRIFQWLSHEPILPLGKPGEWDQGSIYANPDLVHLPDGRLALPYNAYGTTHNQGAYSSFYKDYKNPTGIAWATWEDGRLAGIEAEDFGGLTTQEALFQGTQIKFNARTSRGGSVELELREHGKPIEGFLFSDCLPFNGDELWTTAKWKGKSTLEGLRGKKLELGIRLSRATIFAYKYV
jgi:hypothetical protein